MTDDTAYLGFRGIVPPIPDLLANLGKAAGPAEIQLLRADRVYGVDHLRSAVHHADRALANGTNVASAWPLEVLCYAAGERQINRAIAFLGLEPGEGTVAAVVRGEPAGFLDLADTLGWDRDDGVLDGGEDVLDAWGISAAQRASLPTARRDELVLERVALADTR